MEEKVKIMKEIEEAQFTLYNKFIDIVDNCYLILSDEDFKRLEDYCKNILVKEVGSHIKHLNFQFGEVIVKEARTTETSHLLVKRKEGNIFVKCNLGTNEIITVEAKSSCLEYCSNFALYLMAIVFSLC